MCCNINTANIRKKASWLVIMILIPAIVINLAFGAGYSSGAGIAFNAYNTTNSIQTNSTIQQIPQTLQPSPSPASLQSITQEISDEEAQALANSQNSFSVNNALSQMSSIPIVIPSSSVAVTIGGVTTYVTIPPITESYFIPNSMSSIIQNAFQSALSQATQSAMIQLQGQIQTDIQNALATSLGSSPVSQASTEIASSVASTLSSELQGSLTSALQPNIGTIITQQTISSISSIAYQNVQSNIQGELDAAVSSALSTYMPSSSSTNIGSIASGIVSGIIPSVESGISTATYSSLSPLIGQQLSLSEASSIPSQIESSAISSVSSSVDGYVQQNIQNIIPGYTGGISASSALSSVIQSELLNSLGTTLSGELGPGFQGDLGQSIYGILSSDLSQNLPAALTSGNVGALSTTLSSQLSQQLTTALPQQLSQQLSTQLSTSLAQSLSSSLSLSLSQTLGSSLSGSIAQSMASSFSQSLSSSLSLSLSQTLGSSLQSSISKGLSQSFASSMQNSLSSALGSSAASFGTNLQNSLQGSLNSALQQQFSNLQSGLETQLQSALQQDIQGNLQQSLLGTMGPSLSSAISSNLYSSFQGYLSSGMKSSLTQSLTTSLGSTFKSGLQSSISSGINQALQGSIGSISTSGLSSGIASSLSSSIGASLSQSLPNLLSSSIGSGISSSLTSNLYSSLGQSLSSTVSSSVESALESQLGTSVSSAIAQAVPQGIAGALTTPIQQGIQTAFTSGLSSALTTASGSLSSGLTTSLISSMTSAIGPSMTQAFGSTFSTAVQSGIQSAFTTSVQNAFVQGVGNGFSQGFSTLSGSLAQGIGTAISTSISSSVSSSIQSSLSGILPTSLSAAVGSGIGTALSGSVSSALSSTFGSSIFSSSTSTTSLSQDLSTAASSAASSYLQEKLGISLPSSLINSFIGSTGINNQMLSSLSSLFGSSSTTTSSSAGSIAGSSWGSSSSSSSQDLSYLNAALSIISGQFFIFNLEVPVEFSTSYSINSYKVSSSKGSEQAVSPTNSVYSFDTSPSVAGWFLTCPTSSMGLYSSSDKFVGGNGCINPSSNLQSAAIMTSTVYNFYVEPAWTTLGGLTAYNFGELLSQVYAYVPQVDGEISNGFSTQSYIFQSVPSFAQHALWAWSAPYAELSNAKLPASSSYTSPGLMTLAVCNYRYVYNVKETLSSLNNINIPFDYSSKSGSTSANKLTVYNTPVLPYLFMNWNITTNPQTTYTTPNLTGPTSGIFTPLTYGTFNAIEPYPIDIPSLMIANFSSSGSSQSTSVFNASGTAVQLSGNEAILNGKIYKIISIASTPNNYVYLLFSNMTTITTTVTINAQKDTKTISVTVSNVTGSKTTTTSITQSGGFLTSSSSSSSTTSQGYYLTIARAIKHGYYQTPNPNFPGPVSCTSISGGVYTSATSVPLTACSTSGLQSQFDSAWNSYWTSAAVQDNVSMYLVNPISQAIPITLSGFQPLNISVDYKGDVFIVGLQSATPASQGSTLHFSGINSSTGASSTGTNSIMNQIEFSSADSPISLSYDTGSQSIVVQGSGFTPGSQLGIQVVGGSNCKINGQSQTVTIASDGTYSTSFSAAEAASSYTCQFEEGFNNENEPSITVPQTSTLTISATYNALNQDIIVSGSGASSGIGPDSVTVNAITTAQCSNPNDFVQADSAGQFSDSFSETPQTSAYTCDVYAIDNINGAKSPTVSVTVTGTGTTAAPNPQITATYDTTTQMITVTGTGFSPGSAVPILPAAGSCNGYVTGTTVNANANGDINTQISGALQGRTQYTCVLSATYLSNGNQENTPSVTVTIPVAANTWSFPISASFTYSKVGNIDQSVLGQIVVTGTAEDSLLNPESGLNVNLQATFTCNDPQGCVQQTTSGTNPTTLMANGEPITINGGSVTSGAGGSFTGYINISIDDAGQTFSGYATVGNGGLADFGPVSVPPMTLSASYNQNNGAVNVIGTGFPANAKVSFYCATLFGSSGAPSGATSNCQSISVTANAMGDISSTQLMSISMSTAYASTIYIYAFTGYHIAMAQNLFSSGDTTGGEGWADAQTQIGVAQILPGTALVKMQNLVANTIGVCTTQSCFYSTYEQPNDLIKVALQDVAVSPSGAQLYLSGVNDNGAIYVVSGNDMSTVQSTIPLGFASNSVTLTPSGQTGTTASASLSPSALNITYWLAMNGLYNKSISWLPPQSNNVFETGGNNYDQNTFHHPLGLADVNGYIYVLDDWSGIVGGNDPQIPNGKSNNGIFFNILLLRAINSTGSNVPIQPTLFNDMFSNPTCAGTSLYYTQIQNKCLSATSSVIENNGNSKLCVQPAGISTNGCVLAPIPDTCNLENYFLDLGSSYQSQWQCVNIATETPSYTTLATASGSYTSTGYPPYGWVISANISGVNQNEIKDSFSMCSSFECTLNPDQLISNVNSYTGGYAPIGPAIKAVGNSAGSSCSGTCSSLESIHGVGFSVNYNNTAALLFPNKTNQPGSGDGLQNWGEMIIAHVGWQNYTNLFTGVQNYTCIVKGVENNNQNVCGTKFVNGIFKNIYNPAVDDISAPILMLGDPFKYYENIGTQQPLSYLNQFSSTFNNGNQGGSGSPSQEVSTACINQVEAGEVPTACVGQSGSSITSAASINNLGSLSSISASAQSHVVVPKLTSNVNGEVLIPYSWTGSVQQSWTDIIYIGGLGLYFCPATIPNIYETTTKTQYTYATVPNSLPASQTSLIESIEGGPTYLIYNNALRTGPYTPNLTDFGTDLQPEIFMNVTGNRVLGGMYVNLTTSPTTNKQEILNATEQLNYVINTFSIGPNMKFETINSVVVGPYYGTNYAAGIKPQSNSQNLNVGLGYSQTPSPGSGFVNLNLFNTYQQFVYQSPVQLFINSTYQGLPYGYRRLIYVLQDRFNNTIFAPIDADIGKFTVINMNVNPTVSPTNANMSNVNISGVAGYYQLGSTGLKYQPLANGNVYLYYNDNLNFLNYNALNPNNHNQFDAQICAFGTSTDQANAKLTCTLADPIDQSQAAIAGLVTYSPQYNSSGTCSNATAFLAPPSYNCNIYVDTNICQQQSTPTHQEFCIPEDPSGDGVCSSQLGLIGEYTTNAMGYFSTNIVSCGITNTRIVAQFYGSPSPEPVNAIQSPLYIAANPAVPDTGAPLQNPGLHPTQVSFQVYNYTWIPNETAVTTQIGLWELSYGDVSSLETILVIAIVGALVAIKLITVRKSKRGVARKKKPAKRNNRK